MGKQKRKSVERYVDDPEKIRKRYLKILHETTRKTIISDPSTIVSKEVLEEQSELNKKKKGVKQ